VLDNFGQPVTGAKVEVPGSAFSTASDSSGHFELDYAPGTFSITVAATGYMPHTRQLAVTERVRYPLGTVPVVRIPPADGLRVQGPNEYTLVKGQRLPEKNRLVSAAWSAHCVDTLIPPLVPTIRGSKFVAFVPGIPEQNFFLLQPRGGALSSVPTSMMSNCGSDAAPFAFGVNWTQAGSQRMLEGVLATGVYCVAQVADFGLHKGVANLGRSYCFRWELSPAEAKSPR
jgi:hypothetical protein